MIRPRRLFLPLTMGVATVGLVFPVGAFAHGIVGKADLPIPVWLFSWAAAIVLVVSFVGLSALWRSPRLQTPSLHRLLRFPSGLERLAGAVGLALFVVVLYSGFVGTQESTANFSVTFIYVIFWVGLPVLSVLFGDVFRAFSPWRTVARMIAALVGRVRQMSRPEGGSFSSPPSTAPKDAPGSLFGYPRWLGVWPAVATLVGFGWLELVYVSPDRDRPSLLAGLAVGYFVVMVLGMLLFGVERWGDRADGFGVYFNLLSRMSVLSRDDQGYLCLRRPLSGLPGVPMRRGTVALLCVLIGTTTFDGVSNGGLWRENEPSLESLFADLGLHQTAAQEFAYSLGLLLCICLIGAVYRLGIAGVRSVSSRYDEGELARTFAHTLVPIAFAYVLAHYFSLLIWQSQAMIYLSSDPLGNGSNLLGTSSYQINYQIISYAAIWYVQVGALVTGHVGGLVLAHDRALVLYRDPREAIRSQYWMLAVMVAFTSFGLWLLSSVGT